MQWWGHSKEHGWVVLDRSIPTNTPGLKGDVQFFRCRDSTTFVEERKNWNLPKYKFAPNYIRDLPPAESAEAAAAFEAVQARWPEYQQQLQREHGETEEQAKAARVRSEKKQKEAGRKSKSKPPSPVDEETAT